MRAINPSRGIMQRRLIKPVGDDVDPRAQIPELLRGARVPEEHISWLADAIVAAALGKREDYGDDGDLEAHMEHVVRAVQLAFEAYPASNDAALVECLRRISQNAVGGIVPEPLPSKFRNGLSCRLSVLWRLLPFFADPRRQIDFNRALGEVRAGLTPNEERPAFIQALVLWLHARGCLDLARFATPESIRSHKGGGRSGERPLEGLDQLWFWLRCIGPKALSDFLPVFEQEPAATLPELARGVVRAIDLACMGRGRGATRPTESRRCTAALQPYLRRLEAVASSDARLELLGAYWYVAYRAFGHDRGRLPPESRKNVVGSARRALGQLRALLERAPSAEAKQEFERARYHLSDAVVVLGLFDGLWPALKPLLLALRALRARGVARDLRYWSEDLLERSDPLPQPWSWVAERFGGAIHTFSRYEEPRDLGLTRVREAFAEFCLERLKSETGKPGMPPVEESPIWRQCLVQAIRELRVNPRGRGHHVLHFCEANDPDEEVRKDARIAYDEMRRGVTLPPGSSPRRALFAAFWWLRQAHVLTVDPDVDIDERGAQRTRQKETRRTKEIEEAERMPSQTP
ncbi:MAG TPA: hypothetical protein VHF22_06720 [Planctomycetota bacterium]|nr:hypothetical protein [Planctomycetota bacterium]